MDDSTLPNPGSSPQVPPSQAVTSPQALLGPAPDIERLQSALLAIPPADDIKVIAYHYVAPMAKAAIEFPEVLDSMKALACKWACGELHDGNHSGLMAFTRGGLTGKELFEEIWKYFLTDTQYKGPRRSLGSIYHIAKAAGWTYF